MVTKFGPETLQGKKVFVRLKLGGKYMHVLIPVSVDTEKKTYVRYVPKIPFMSKEDIEKQYALDINKITSAALKDTPIVHESLDGDYVETNYVSIIIMDGASCLFRQE